jgi:hypothetical protein
MEHIDQFTDDVTDLLRRHAEEKAAREGREDHTAMRRVEAMAASEGRVPDVRPGFDPVVMLARIDRPPPVASPGYSRTALVMLTEEDREAIAAAFRPMRPAFAYRASFIDGVPLNRPMRILATCHDWRPLAWLGLLGRPYRKSRRTPAEDACSALARWRPLAGVAEALRPLIDPRPRRTVLVGPPTADFTQAKPVPAGWEVV